MRPFALADADNAALVYPVYHYATGRVRSMNDSLLIQYNAHMYDFSLGVIKESQVTAVGMLQKIHRFAYLCLLSCISRNGMPAKLIGHLGKP
jgi:hypothetical protein